LPGRYELFVPTRQTSGATGSGQRGTYAALRGAHGGSCRCRGGRGGLLARSRMMHYVRMGRRDLVWRPAPGWPDSPPGWTPPPGWQPPADWPPAPADWVFWQPAEPRVPTPIVAADTTRESLARETRFVMIAALTAWIVNAVVILAVHLDRNSALVQLPSLTPNQPVLNVVLGVISYTPRWRSCRSCSSCSRAPGSHLRTSD
jgi:hypothetical protein